MLPTAEIDAMKATQEQNLPETVLILRATHSSDGAGGVSENWQAAGTVNGRIAAVHWQPNEMELAARLTASQKYVVTLPVGTNVTETDRLKVSSRQFGIIGVQRRSQATAVRITCVEVP